MSNPNDELRFTTRQLHEGGHHSDAVNPRATPVYLTAGFVFDDFDHARDRFAGTAEGHTYTRLGNPTIGAVEERITALEGGIGGVLVSSGQAAISSAVLGLAGAGAHLVSASSIYEGSRGLFLENFGRLGITTDFVDDLNSAEQWERAIRPETRALFVESISNPANEVADIALIAGIARRHRIPLIVDNTLATPYLFRPLEHGADIVVHSTSKFLSGQGSVLGGIIIDGGSYDWAEREGAYPHLTEPSYSLGGQNFVEQYGPAAYLASLRSVVIPRFGPTASPFNAFQLLQGVETLSIRVARQSASALALAQWLEQRDDVDDVSYSGLASSPFHEAAVRQYPRGFGSVFSFTVAGGEAAAKALYDELSIITRMTHLGDVRTLILHPRTTTHTLRDPAELDAAGILPGTLRLSVGLEDVPDLIADLERGFAAAAIAAGAEAGAGAGVAGEADGSPARPAASDRDDAPAGPAAPAFDGARTGVQVTR